MRANEGYRLMATSRRRLPKRHWQRPNPRPGSWPAVSAKSTARQRGALARRHLNFARRGRSRTAADHRHERAERSEGREHEEHVADRGKERDLRYIRGAFGDG